MKNKYITLIFILIELALFPFAVFIFPNNRIPQYSAVVIAFIYSIYMSFKKDDQLIITIALFNTLIADLFILLLEKYIEVGMIFFIITQLVYFFLVFKNENKTKAIIHLSVLGVLLIGSITGVLLILKDNVNMIIIESCIYGSLLLTNMAFSFTNFKLFKTVSIGLLLFVFCDLGVAYGFLKDMGLVYSEFISSLPFNYVWIFYLPSQALISLNK